MTDDAADAGLRLVGDEGLVLRTVVPADTAALRAVFDGPEVRRWWGEHDDERLQADVVAPPAGTVSLAVEVVGEVVGVLQLTEEPEPDYRYASIDIALRDDVQGRGLGPRAVRLACRHLFDVDGHHRVTIDPAVDNVRAVAAYRKVGFREVGVMRRYERRGDGEFHDGLLMDLLAEELVE